MVKPEPTRPVDDIGLKTLVFDYPHHRHDSVCEAMRVVIRAWTPCGCRNRHPAPDPFDPFDWLERLPGARHDGFIQMSPAADPLPDSTEETRS